MNISPTGNPKTMTAQAGAAEALPAAEGAAVREKPAQSAPNLTVTEVPAQAGSAGIPPAELEKAITRDDALGKLVDKALGRVSSKDIPAKVAEMLVKSQDETAKATIDGMRPSEREIEMRKEALRRDAMKADERRAEEVAAERLRAQLTAGLLPGEKGLVRDELDRILVRA